MTQVTKYRYLPKKGVTVRLHIGILESVVVEDILCPSPWAWLVKTKAIWISSDSPTAPAWRDGLSGVLCWFSFCFGFYWLKPIHFGQQLFSKKKHYLCIPVFVVFISRTNHLYQPVWSYLERTKKNISQYFSTKKIYYVFFRRINSFN